MNHIIFEKDFVIFELKKYIDITNLLNTTITLKHIKKKIIHRKLNKKYSLKYYNNSDFQILVKNSIENPYLQLTLRLIQCNQITDVSALGNVHALYLSV